MAVPYLSFKGLFRQSELPVYLNFDNHLNESGHNIAANALYERLEQFEH